MKLYKHNNLKQPVCYFKTDEQIDIPETYQDKPLKGLWVSNVLNIDMPIFDDIKTYQKKFTEIIQTCKAYNINTLFFQVRTTNDAFYESKLNPYSRYFTGKEGKKPQTDALKWMIYLAKKNNISFHAWLNPYRVSMKSDLNKTQYLETCDDLNFAKKHPEYLVRDHRGQFILNPARREVKDFILESIKELIEHYDVDGIHFDDYFYPYGGLVDEDNDLKDYEQRTDINESLGDFRRRQVSEVIKEVHDMIQKVNPKLRFGVSPFGIWKNKTEKEHGSNTDTRCSQSFDNEFADSYLWVKKGYVDYIVPQIYWDFEHEIAPFADIARFWVDAVKDTNVDLYIGHGAYRLGNAGGYENPYEIVNQVRYVSQFDNVLGHVFFTYHTFIDEGQTEEGMRLLKKLFNGGDINA